MQPNRAQTAILTLTLAWLSVGCGSSPEPQPTNILIISVDTLRADHLGCYGYQRDTSPVIDRLAAESILFETCLSPLAATLPAHTSLFTGTHPLEHGVLGNIKGGGRRFVANPALRLFAEFASESGYRTAGFVSAASVSEHTGIALGFDVWDEPESIRRVASATNAPLLDWIDRFDDDRPFFLFAHYFDPHWPYEPPEEFAGRFDEDTAFLERYVRDREIADSAPRPNQALLETRESINGYDCEIRYVDAELGRLIERLEQRGLWEETAVILVGDHGEGLGEHGQIGHGWIYREQLQVPLMMRIPGHGARRVATPLSIMDTLPTALSLIGGPWEGFLRQATGDNVLAEDYQPQPILNRRSARERDDLPGIAYALSAGRWKYVYDPERGDRLFDWEDDPLELTDLLERQPERSEAMRRELLALVELYERRGRALGEIPPDQEMSPEMLEKLRSLGYLD